MSTETITRISRILAITPAMVAFLYAADSELLRRLNDEENELSDKVHRLVQLDEEI